MERGTAKLTADWRPLVGKAQPVTNYKLQIVLVARFTDRTLFDKLDRSVDVWSIHSDQARRGNRYLSTRLGLYRNTICYQSTHLFRPTRDGAYNGNG